MPIPQFTAGQVLTAAELNAMVDAINAGGAVKVTRFTASGTFTPPTGVTYAVAYMTGGGGGVSAGGGTAGTGGTSSVAFAAGTVSAIGGLGQVALGNIATGSIAGTANSGNGASGEFYGGVSYYSSGFNGPQSGATIVAGGEVTAGVGITVTVGNGGTAGTGGAAGGTGYVYIEYAGS